jgi:methionyl-tRNA formyltransferase
MRLIFAGTPEFARVALEQLHAAGFEIALVLSQPDRPAGRGMKLQASSVKQWAQAHQTAVAQPRSLRLDGKYPDDALAAHDLMQAARADAIVVAAYGLILPQWVLDLPPLGCLNIHASLLPRWRGAAPIHRAIEAGDAQTGVTIMQMDAGLDTGAMLLSASTSITANDSTESLHDRLASMGGELIVKALAQAAKRALKPQAQPTQGVTYAQKIEKHEALIDWSLSAGKIEQRIRAFNPFPVASSSLKEEVIKFRQACLIPLSAPIGALPGQVLAVGDAGVDVCTADGVLRVTQLQKAGGKALAAADFLRGFEIQVGMVFGANQSVKV